LVVGKKKTTKTLIKRLRTERPSAQLMGEAAWEIEHLEAKIRSLNNTIEILSSKKKIDNYQPAIRVPNGYYVPAFGSRSIF